AAVFPSGAARAPRHEDPRERRDRQHDDPDEHADEQPTRSADGEVEPRAAHGRLGQPHGGRLEHGAERIGPRRGRWLPPRRGPAARRPCAGGDARCAASAAIDSTMTPTSTPMSSPRDPRMVKLNPGRPTGALGSPTAVGSSTGPSASGRGAVAGSPHDAARPPAGLALAATPGAPPATPVPFAPPGRLAPLAVLAAGAGFPAPPLLFPADTAAWTMAGLSFKVARGASAS